MTKSSNQNGSALTFIVILITVAIIGVLGYVAWQRFFNPANPESQVSQDAVKVANTPPETNTFNSEAIGVSFTYPKEWVSLTCAGNPNVAYFGSDIRGIGNGNESLLCGGGSDFPAQMTFAVQDNYIDEAVNSKPVTIDGQEATKSVIIAAEDSIYPAGFEVTKYVVSLNNGKTATFIYSKWPASESASYDTTNETREEFKRLIENSLKINS